MKKPTAYQATITELELGRWARLCRLLFARGVPGFHQIVARQNGLVVKIVSVKQSLWTLREAGTKKGRRATGDPLIL